MTSRYADTVTDQYARPIPGALVYVYVWDLSAETAGALEALTADNATSLSNPLTTDQFGGFYFNAPNGAKLIEVHFGGKLQYREQIQVGPIPSGPPGGPGALFGLFTNLINITAGGATLIASSGYSTLDKGAAVYVADAAVNSAYVAANPLSSGITADGIGFRLSLEQPLDPQIFGADPSGVADSSPAFAAAIAYTPAGGGDITVLGGTYKLLTEPTWGSKQIVWDISPAATFTGAGTGGSLFPATARTFDVGLRTDLLGVPGTAVADVAITAGQLVNLFVSGGVTHMQLADASVQNKPAHAFCPVNVAIGATASWRRRGVIAGTSATTFAADLWLSETVPGGTQSTAPATAGHISQHVGMVLPGVGIEFNPLPEIDL